MCVVYTRNPITCTGVAGLRHGAAVAHPTAAQHTPLSPRALLSQARSAQRDRGRHKTPTHSSPLDREGQEMHEVAPSQKQAVDHLVASVWGDMHLLDIIQNY